MDAHRADPLTAPDTPLDDQVCTDLDVALRQALSVEPSQEFLARIRTRIANEPIASTWELPWKAVTAGGFAVIAIAAVFVARSQRVTQPRDLNASAGATAVARAEAPDLTASVTTAARPPARQQRAPVLAEVDSAPATGRTAARRGRTEVPEVIISREDAAAMRWFLGAVARGEIDPGRLSDIDAALAAGTQELAFEPVVIRPLEDIEPLESVTQ